MSLVTPDGVRQSIADAQLDVLTDRSYSQLADYVNLLIRWNARVNLTAIREPEEILKRHIVESVAAAQVLPAGTETMLDYGTGAGLPGIPIAIVRDKILVTLAESQSKKVAFLQEAVRTIPLRAAIHAGRVDELPFELKFSAVTLRAVDNMHLAVADARHRVKSGGHMLLFSTAQTREALIAVAQPAKVVEEKLPGIGFLLICTIDKS